MKKLCLECTEQELLNTYRDDSIGRNRYVRHFIDVLDSLEEGTIIALDGRWGSGKTFFIKQTKCILDSLNAYSIEEDGKLPDILEKFRDLWYAHNADMNPSVLEFPLCIRPHYCVYYDAWLNDCSNDPLLSLIYAIYSGTKRDYTFSQFKKFDDILKSILDLNLPLPKKYLDISLLIRLKLFFSNLKAKDSIFDRIKDEKRLDEKIHEFLESILPEKGDRFVIFIDELDRCNPDYAVRLLERIKHYFTHERITFVLSVDAVQLQATIRHHYGDNFNASRYLDRFFDIRFNLPDIDTNKYIQYLGLTTHNYSHISVIIEHYHFRMREITRYLRLLKIALPYGDYELKDEYGLSVTQAFLDRLIVPFLIALKLHDLVEYEVFIHGGNSEPIESLFDSELGAKYTNRFLYTEEEQRMCAYHERRQRLLNVYNALFVPDKLQPSIEIGSITISQAERDYLFRVVSLLSDNAQYDDEP